MKYQFHNQTIDEIHIELTSKCTLACPRCARTLDPNGFVVEDLDLGVIESALKSDALLELELVYLCGNHGDPIYHKKFHDVIRLIKSYDVRVEIETNGSYRKPSWWRELAELLDENDMISFSVDGLYEANTNYRVNADWDSIFDGMTIMAGSRAKVNWKWILFNYNEDDTDKAIELAVDIGLDTFTIVKSGLFGEQYADETGKDPLEPRPENRIWFPAHDTKKKIYPRCKKQPRPFINAAGLYIPCCWAGNAWAFNGGFFDKNKKELKIGNYDEIVSSHVLEELEKSWESIETAPKECVALCGRDSPPDGWGEDNYRSSYDKEVIDLSSRRNK